MFRSNPWRNAIARIVKVAPQARAPGKRYLNRDFNPYHFSSPPVRALRPTLWVFTAAGTIYLGCAAFEVYQDVREFKKRQQKPVTYSDIDGARKNKGNSEAASTFQFSIADVFATPWSNLNSAEKMLTTATALNVGIYGACRFAPPGLWLNFAHIPASFRNFTLFSSMFGHSGLLHLSVNMFALSSFGPSLAASPTFDSSGAHLTAFYLSSGLIASLTYHLATIWPNKMSRLSPSLGASGAIMAILGAWAMNYPEGRIGIILIPGSLPAEQALLGLLAFETWGTFIGYGGFLRIGHGAHLGGLLAGVGYVMYDGKNRLWQPARRFAFNQMQRLKLI